METDGATQERDDSHNASLPEWKRECIRLYGDCTEALYRGPCYDWRPPLSEKRS